MDTASDPLVSGEGVALDLPTAGVASRAVAAVIDLVAVGAALVLVLTFVLPFVAASDDAALTAVALTLVLLLAVGYPVLGEWLGRGRTLGKIAMGLRVVRDDGGPVGFRQALVRALSGLLLEKPGALSPFGTFAGALTVTASARNKRIGDLLAGTVVLNERAASQPTARPFPWVPPELVPWLQSLDLSGFDQQLAHSVRTFVSRAYAMSEAGRDVLGAQLRDRVLAAVRSTPPPGVPTPVLLQSVLAERRRRAELGVFAGSPTATAVPGSPRPTVRAPAAPDGFALPS